MNLVGHAGPISPVPIRVHLRSRIRNGKESGLSIRLQRFTLLLTHALLCKLVIYAPYSYTTFHREMSLDRVLAIVVATCSMVIALVLSPWNTASLRTTLEINTTAAIVREKVHTPHAQCGGF